MTDNTRDIALDIKPRMGYLPYIMDGEAKLLRAMREAPQTVRYAELRRLCVKCFGDPRQTGTSHCVFKTPWPGDPRVNIQEGKGGKAKAYQVRQVLTAIEKLRAMEAK